MLIIIELGLKKGMVMRAELKCFRKCTGNGNGPIFTDRYCFLLLLLTGTLIASSIQQEMSAWRN
jgi:hypothetical protein